MKRAEALKEKTTIFTTEVTEDAEYKREGERKSFLRILNRQYLRSKEKNRFIYSKKNLRSSIPRSVISVTSVVIVFFQFSTFNFQCRRSLQG